MQDTIENLKEKLKKAYDKKEKAEDEIKRISAKIEQLELTTIKATLREYNIQPSDLPELLKKLRQGDIGAVENYAET